MARYSEPGSGSSSDIENAAHLRPAEREKSIESINTLNKTGTTDTQYTVVEGSSRLYKLGERQYVPMPTGDPRDPLNLPTWRKILTISSVCLFGAMAIAPEAILAALLPVFVFEYAGIDPHVLDGLHSGLPQAKGGGVVVSGSGLLGGLGGPPYWKITLISTLPVLVIGISNYLLVPLSIAIGRRPVIIVCGLLAWIGAIWAGKSTSLESHLGARSLQAIGAGTVESLIPLIVQDMVFIHWRNRCFSAVWASQGIIIVTLGICSPLIISDYTWRFLYNICAIMAAITWLIILITLPETRYFRSTQELRGEPLEPLEPGKLKPDIDYVRYGRRTWWDEIGVFTMGFAWGRAWEAVLASLKSFFFPNIFWVIVLNGLFSAVSLAAGQTGAVVLLTQPNSWPFRILGLAVLPIVIASFFVALFAGYGADRISNFITKKYRGGLRDPEVHLINLFVPMIFAIIGCIMFGYGGTYIGHVSWAVFVVGIGFLSFGLLSANVIFSTYVVESYPEWAGPVLVNVASARNIIGFGFSFKVTDWIGQLGFLKMFGVYAGVIALLSLGLIPMYIYGRQTRKFCGKWVQSLDETPAQYHEKRQRSLRESATVPEKRGATQGTAPVLRTYRASEPLVVQGTSISRSVSKVEPAVTHKTSRSVSKAEGAVVHETKQERATTEPAKKKGKIDWAKVRENLNMKDNWRDAPGH